MTQAPTPDNQAQLLAGVLDSSLDGIYAFQSLRDEQGQIVDFIFTVVNKAAEQMVGRTAELLLGKRMLKMLPGNKSDGLFDAYVKVVESGEPFITEHYYEHDGLANWFRISATKNGDGFTVSFADITASKNSEERFRILFEQLAEAQELANIGSWEWDAKEDRTIWSTQTRRIFGIPEDGPAPGFDEHTQQIHPDDLDHWKTVVNKIMEDHKPYVMRFRTVRPDGTVRTVEARGQADVDTYGTVERLFGTVQDITEQELSRQQHDLAVQRFELMVTGSSSGVWDWDCKTDSLYWSPRFKELVGYADNEISPTYEDFESRLHPLDKENTLESLNRHLKDREPYDVEYRLKHKDGHYFWCHAAGQAQWDGQGNPIRMAGSIVGIDERKATQLELEVQRNRLTFALDASRTGLWDWDVAGHTVFYSDTWYTMLGYKPGELPMTFDTWSGLAHPEDLPNASNEIQRYMDAEIEQYAIEMRMRNKAGDWQWVKTVGEAAERNEDGSIKRIIGLHLDIHEQKQTQGELAIARDHAQQASDAKSAFVANMSHEIRTPMNAILGFADLLLDSGQSEADKRNHAQTIRRNGHHLMAILNDVLDISKIEAGKMSVERIACEPRQLFADVIGLMTPRAEEKGLSLEIEAVGKIPQGIQTDPTRMRQVLINLVGNAVKFTNEGTVTIRVSHQLAGHDEIELTCEVIDTGIGIAEQQADRLFQPFSQADESTTRTFGGTGLGLTISKQLCRLMGGDLSYKSTPGQGSTFTATFRVGQAETNDTRKKTKPRRDIAPDVLRGRRILVVEDGADNQRLIKHFLIKAGAFVEIAENGAEGRDAALQALRENQVFDVVLMDMQMPVLDGYSATTELREEGYTQPIIALTAHASANDRKTCLDAGCDDYLTKPIDRDKLVTAIIDHLDRQLTHGYGI